MILFEKEMDQYSDSYTVSVDCDSTVVIHNYIFQTKSLIKTVILLYQAMLHHTIDSCRETSSWL